MDNHLPRQIKNYGQALHCWALIVLLAAAWLAATSGQAWAHGVHMSCAPGQAMILDAYYDGGDLMSFVKLKITGPDGKTYQVGNTDAKGRFAFVPDKAGKWTLVANDGMGHRAELTVDAAPGGQATKANVQSSDPGVPMWARAAWGLSAFMFIFGLFSWFAARRRTK